MKNKVKKTIIGVIIALLSSILTIIIFNINHNRIDIQQVNDSWSIYDKSIEQIKNNMESITEPNENFDWWVLKDFDINDDEYESVLDLLVADVRMCYLEYTDDGTLYTNTNPIRKYREKEYINSKELDKLNFEMYYEFNQGCLKSFERYNALLISNDELLRNNVLSKTNKIFRISSQEIFNNKNATYNELLLRKIIEVDYLEDISEFLVKEYNRLK